MEEEIEGTQTTNPKQKSHNQGRSIDKYAAQCGKCLKWRVINTQEEYEEIRSRQQEDPFVCEKKQGASCQEPADINYDSSRTWAIDKPGLPKTPRGFKRSLVLRKDYSKMDAYYITPTGKKLRTRNEIAAFLEANPVYKDSPLGDFNFTVPKVMEDTLPPGIIKGGSPSGMSSKSSKPSKDN
ncbi:PREDICTED: methyl-CpG-binding domain-containing protein 4-like isoform X2 [Tarenaya hassleriana]|uniref:methyl-CpG-binding domain-containing protein 4-like isoform X2 n=1 Tax=Tarenaya hassleriana TaxID=28532 RepID=UPI00053C3AE7|nr:PREDICTED: methyl-CpG-binding domain-containing protein 4-like isoform X2 [Tarenaya hassleriana]